MLDDSELRAIANRVIKGDCDIPMERVGISVFDDWLGSDRLHLLDCKSYDERNDRNRRLLAFWGEIYDGYCVLSRTDAGDFAAPANRDIYLDECRYEPDRTSTEFQCIIIFDLLAIYQEHWDDTNVLWYSDRGRIKPLLQMATSCGLNVLEYTA